MNENEDSTFENLDDPEDMDDNEKGELSSSNNADLQKLKSDYKKRITRLEDIVSRQEVEIHRLKNTCAELEEVSQAFGQLLTLKPNNVSGWVAIQLRLQYF